LGRGACEFLSGHTACGHDIAVRGITSLLVQGEKSVPARAQRTGTPGYFWEIERSLLA